MGLIALKTFLELGSIGMIGRIWHGTVPVEKSDAYLEKMRKRPGNPTYRDWEDVDSVHH